MVSEVSKSSGCNVAIEIPNIFIPGQSLNASAHASKG